MPAPLLSRPVLRLGTTTLLSLMPVLVAGCDRLGGTTDVNARVREVRVDPATETILAGGTRTFSAVALDAAGGPIASARFTWATSDTSVAVVDTAGAVTARGAGTATITARVGRSAGSATVTVVAGVRLGFVQPTRDGGRRFSREGPYHLELLPGDSLVLLLMMQGGGGFPFSPPLHGAVWASSDTAIVQARPLPTPGDSGVVLRSLMPGEATISARYQGFTSTMVARVTTVDSLVPTYRSLLLPSGGREVCVVIQAFTPLGRLEMEPSRVRWTSSDTSVARVTRLITNAGCLTTGQPGSATITEEIAGLSTHTLVRVADVRVGRLTPALDTISVGQTLVLGAAWGDGLNNWFDLELEPVWTSSNPAIASVQGWIGATVTGNAVGWATVTAWVDGVFAQATVFVVAPDSAAARRQPTIDQEVIRRGPLRQRS